MIHRSTKAIKDLKHIVGQRLFNLPRSMANDIDLKSGKPCIYVGINGKSFYVPVETSTPIPYDVFCALKDIGILEHYESYVDGEEFQ